MNPIDTPEWADNPRLNTWLAAQREAFPLWAEEHGGGWDFTIDSLDRLEALLRDRFATWEEARAAADGPLLSVAAWYLGETLIRSSGAAWRCVPTEPPTDLPAGGKPLLIIPLETMTDRELSALEREAKRGDDPRPYVEPAGELSSMFAVGPDHRLRDALEWFEDFAQWRVRVARR
ncbi:hypothetical protein ACFV2H_05950 [Streptomyces sp. NPDC059629]|uniref:hypothetical protein n=1 Tax=Streptomyces sp. NPDC059629 TaxID=3346889 RepID=UPI0036BCF72C